MALPKPEYIQNFINEKIKKTKKTEKQPLLNGDEILNSHDEKPVIRKDRVPRAIKRINGTNILSSGISESDDSSQPPKNSLPAKEEEKTRKKSLGSDADCDTDDSGDKTRRKGSICASSARKMKKSKDIKSCLKQNNDISASYGGTSFVELDCAEALASYCPKGIKSSIPAETASSSTNKNYQASFNNGLHHKKPHSYKSSNRTNAKEKLIDEQIYLYSQKHNEDSSNSDFGLQNGLRRESMESEHCHDSSDERSEREEKKRKKAMRKLMIATGLSFIFMVGEVVGGYLANSLAIMTDASHLLTDVSSFMISILALKMASRPISKKMTFGWHRAEVIGALVSVLAIWIVTGVLVYLAIVRLVTNKYQVNGKNMLITAGLAVGFNILMGLVLHEHGHFGGHSHGHSHGHGHDHESGSNASGAEEESNESGNVNVRAAFIHVVGDLLQSLGVLIAAFIIYFKPSYKIADPICTFLFSIFVLITTITILRDTIIIIMEGSPVNIEYNVVKDKLLEIEGVTAVHDLRIWSLTLNQTVMSGHLAIDKYADPNTILKKATRRLKALYDFHSLTIQVEYYSDDMNRCKRCQPAAK